MHGVERVGDHTVQSMDSWDISLSSGDICDQYHDLLLFDFHVMDGSDDL